MDSKAIQDNQIKSSSIRDAGSLARYGRLNHNPPWCASNADMNINFTVDFLQIMSVTGLAMRGEFDTNNWITEFSIQYSYDNKTYGFVLDDNDGSQKVSKYFHTSTLPIVFLHKIERQV